VAGHRGTRPGPGRDGSLPPDLEPPDLDPPDTDPLDIEDVEVLRDAVRRSRRDAATSLGLLRAYEAAAPAGFGFLDGGFRFVRVNETLAAISGLPAQRHVGQYGGDALPAVWSQVEAGCRRVWQSGTAVLDVPVRAPLAADPGRVRSWLASCSPVRAGSELVGVGLVLVDVTEREEAPALPRAGTDDVAEARRAELEERHDQKLESLGRLSAGLAHEINTPIQFVGDNTRFLAGAYEDMLELLLVYRSCLAPALGEMAWPERTRQAQEAEVKADVDYLAAEIPAAVTQSLEGVERVASLVRAMKSFSYKDSTEQTYADLNEAIRTTLTVARNEVKYVADVVLDLGELPEVLCHRGDLNQVFLNLLVNAADALEDKGERGEIRISSAAEGPTAVIRFADNGSGIPEHLRQSIFEPFFTTKGVGKGTGQGLALARAVLDKHGGSIEVRSTVGEGTEFILRLPIDGRRDAGA
jgi:signal transduction histidine kinase